MEIKQIIYFLALCEELHFTRAAKRCGVAQPSLTNAIQALEEEFGAPLFHRKPRPHLSELGMAVQPHLARALANIESALSRRQAPPHSFGRRQGRRFTRVLNGAGHLPAAEKKISVSN
jgi:LysR family hydrogen peroxide-inducible transcriptional activator